MARATSRLRARDVAWASATALMIGVAITVLGYAAGAGDRRVSALEAQSHAALLRADCESLRLLCDEAHPTQGCIDRATLLSWLEGVDDECRRRASAMASGR